MSFAAKTYCTGNTHTQPKLYTRVDKHFTTDAYSPSVTHHKRERNHLDFKDHVTNINIIDTHSCNYNYLVIFKTEISEKY